MESVKSRTFEKVVTKIKRLNERNFPEKVINIDITDRYKYCNGYLKNIDGIFLSEN
jgi:hypothetical protein